MPSKELTLINKLGLHARAAAKFVNLASGFESEVTISRNGKTVNGKSIMGVMMLAASCGTTIEVNTSGNDAEQALQQIEQLVQDRFGEEA
jgi:phosphocarrier protein HPr